MRETVLALSTVQAEFDTRDMVRSLVDRGLAACVTVFPSVRSVYKWDGKIQDSTEQQLLIKTTRDRVEALWSALKALHPYDVPEFLVLPVVDGNPEYLRWIGDTTQ